MNFNKLFISAGGKNGYIFIGILKYLDENLVLLEDHTKIDEPFHGIKFNNGKYNIVIAQRLKSINEASTHLARKGYYINWSDDMYNDVVRWRFESDKS